MVREKCIEEMDEILLILFSAEETLEPEVGQQVNVFVYGCHDVKK